MGSSILDWFSGTYTPTAQQQTEADNWAAANAPAQNDWASRDMSNMDNMPTDAAGMASYNQYLTQQNPSPWGLSNLHSNAQAPVASPVAQPQQQPVSSPNAVSWEWENGGLKQGDVGNAPVYNDVFTQFLGQNYMTGYDPALAMTLNAGGQGAISYGLDAFLQRGSNDSNNPLMNAASEGYKTGDLQQLASRFGLDPGSADLESQLRDKTKDYYGIAGLSTGWNPSSTDARQGNYTLYQRKDGKLVPIQTNAGHMREEGSYLQEHPGILAPLGVVGAGLAAGAAAGAGAASGGGAAASGAGTAGTAAGGTAAANSGWLGSLANYAGLGSQYAAMPGYAQAGLQGALQGAVTSGVTGGNPLLGALTGGVTGGITPGVNSALSGLGGMPQWATNAVGAGGVGAVGSAIGGGNPLYGALSSGVGSGVGGGLAAQGVNPGLASILGRLGGQSATALAQGRDLSSLFTPQQLAMLAANPQTLRALFR